MEERDFFEEKEPEEIVVEQDEIKLIKAPEKATTGGMGPCTGVIIYDETSKQAMIGHFPVLLDRMDKLKDLVNEAKQVFSNFDALKVYVGGLEPDEYSKEGVMKVKAKREEIKKYLADNNLNLTKTQWVNDNDSGLEMKIDTNTGIVEYQIFNLDSE